MNIHEYQGKAILKEFGAPVSPGVAAFTADGDALARLVDAATTLVSGLRHEGKADALIWSFVAISVDDGLAVGPELTDHFETRLVAVGDRAHHDDEVAVAIMVDGGVEHAFDLIRTDRRGDDAEALDASGDLDGRGEVVFHFNCPANLLESRPIVITTLPNGLAEAGHDYWTGGEVDGRKNFWDV